MSDDLSSPSTPRAISEQEFEIRTALMLVRGYLKLLNRHWDDESVPREQLHPHAERALAHRTRLQRVLLPPCE